MEHTVVSRAMKRALRYKVVSLLFSAPWELRRRAEELVSVTPDVAKILQPMNEETVRREYEHAFGHSLNSAFPLYETMYGKENIFQQSSELADISGFYKSWGLSVREGVERLDHISAEAEFMSFMCVKEAGCHDTGQTELVTDTQKRFVNDHIGRWTHALGSSLKDKADSELFRTAGSFLCAVIEEEIRYLGVNPAKLRDIDMKSVAGVPLTSCFECPSSKDCFEGGADLEEEIR